jgi:hypothetical protein
VGDGHLKIPQAHLAEKRHVKKCSIGFTEKVRTRRRASSLFLFRRLSSFPSPENRFSDENGEERDTHPCERVADAQINCYDALGRRLRDHDAL